MQSTFISLTQDRLDWFRSAIEDLNDPAFKFQFSLLKNINLKLIDAERNVLFFDLNDSPNESTFDELKSIASSFAGSIIAVGNAQSSKDILSSLRAGACDYLETNRLRDDLNDIWKRLLKTAIEKPAKGKIVLVMSANGGVGKTTVATNLAIAVNQSFKVSVGLVDFDFDHGDVSGLLHLSPQFSTADLLRPNQSVDAEMFDRTLTPYEKTEVKVLAAPPEISLGAEFSEESILKIIERCRERFPVTIIDMPCGYSTTGQKLMEQADQILVVNSLDFQSIRNVRRFLEFEINQCRIPESKFQIVLNKKGEPYEVDLAKAQEVLNTKLDWFLPNDPKPANLASNVGIPVVIDAPHSALAIAFLKLSDRLMDKLHLSSKNEQLAPAKRSLTKLPSFIASFLM